MRVKWISVEESLPEYNEDVLIVRLNYGSVIIGRRCFTDNQGEHYKHSIYDIRLQDVTHWVSLPALPKQGEET